MPETILGGLLSAHLGIRRSIFVSYYHDGDQQYYDSFSRIFDDTYGIVRDGSLERLIDSDDAEYVRSRIRQSYITGTSCTIVLCGPKTWGRRYVDWEIKATLDKQHGLIAVRLPENVANLLTGSWWVPPRLKENLDSGYAVACEWNDLMTSPSLLAKYIEVANSRSKYLIQNAAPLRQRSSS